MQEAYYTIPPAFPSTGTYVQTQSLCGREYVSPSSTVLFSSDTSIREVSFLIFSLLIRVVTSHVGKASLFFFMI